MAQPNSFGSWMKAIASSLADVEADGRQHNADSTVNSTRNTATRSSHSKMMEDESQYSDSEDDRMDDTRQLRSDSLLNATSSPMSTSSGDTEEPKIWQDLSQGLFTNMSNLLHENHRARVYKLSERTVVKVARTSDMHDYSALMKYNRLDDDDDHLAFLDNEKDVYEHLGEVDGILNIIRIEKYGFEMDLADGGNLETYITNNLAVPYKMKLFWLESLVNTFAEISKLNAIHNFIDPRAILLKTTPDKDGSDSYLMPYVASFADAHMVAASINIHDLPLGPRKVKSDIYNVGWLLYAIEEWVVPKIELGLRHNKKWWSKVNSRRPPHTDHLILETVINKCLSKNYVDMETMRLEALAELKPYLANIAGSKPLYKPNFHYTTYNRDAGDASSSRKSTSTPGVKGKGEDSDSDEGFGFGLLSKRRHVDFQTGKVSKLPRPDPDLWRLS